MNNFYNQFEIYTMINNYLLQYVRIEWRKG